jgi:hypothetical protein
MMAMFGWRDHKMPALYIAKASLAVAFVAISMACPSEPDVKVPIKPKGAFRTLLSLSYARRPSRQPFASCRPSFCGRTFVAARTCDDRKWVAGDLNPRNKPLILLD